MSKRGPALFLQDILGSISKIEEYTKGLSFEEFSKNDEKIDAVVRNLEIIIASRKPRSFRAGMNA